MKARSVAVANTIEIGSSAIKDDCARWPKDPQEEIVKPRRKAHLKQHPFKRLLFNCR